MHHINVLVLPSWRRYSRSTISEYFLPVIALSDKAASGFVHGDNSGYIVHHLAAGLPGQRQTVL